MKAIVYDNYGPPKVLQLKEIEKPKPKDDEVLVKVHSVSLNSSDWEFLTGSPAYVRMWGLFKPKYKILGSDIAGKVETIGKDISEFQPGDEVFGDIMYSYGGFAEYVCVKEDLLMRKPESMTFEEIAALPQAATVALQGLRDKGQIKTGQKVLINGAGGSTGTFAVQLAKYFGAEVTGVDTAKKLDLMRSIGADHVIDYTSEDFTQNGKHYDLILDVKGTRSVFDFKRALSPKGNYVMLGGPVPRILQALFWGPLISLIESKKMGILAHNQNKKDLAFMIELFEAGKVKPVIDRCFPLKDTANALLYLGEGLALGKVVVTV